MAYLIRRTSTSGHRTRYGGCAAGPLQQDPLRHQREAISRGSIINVVHSCTGDEHLSEVSQQAFRCGPGGADAAQQRTTSC